MATKKPAAKTPFTYSVNHCNFVGVSDQQASALMALANAMAEQAKAVQAVAAALKGPDALLSIGGAA